MLRWIWVLSSVFLVGGPNGLNHLWVRLLVGIWRIRGKFGWSGLFLDRRIHVVNFFIGGRGRNYSGWIRNGGTLVKMYIPLVGDVDAWLSFRLFFRGGSVDAVPGLALLEEGGCLVLRVGSVTLFRLAPIGGPTFTPAVPGLLG